MLRDNPVGLIEPMFSSAGANPLALCIAKNESSDDRPPCLENPRPEGAESTLTENAPSPFHAEPKQFSVENAPASIAIASSQRVLFLVAHRVRGTNSANAVTYQNSNSCLHGRTSSYPTTPFWGCRKL
jgi:hypothetical protein